VPVPEQSDGTRPPPPDEGEELSEIPGVAEYPALHNLGVEHRFVAGQFDRLGPATDWIRLRLPVVAGQEPTPLQRVMAAADFGNGVSAIAPFAELTFINADLTVHLHRHPAGEWVCLDSVTRLGEHGSGLAVSDLYDETGPIGRSLQSLLVDRR
jgi:hypothetical protein